MISSRILHFIYIILSLFLLSACTDSAEKTTEKLKPTTSHRTVKEKTVVVPSYVLNRWKAVKLAVIDKINGRENIYSIPIGTEFKVPSSGLVINVESFLPAFTMVGTTITTSSNELVNPGAKVKISDNGVSLFQGWLFMKYPNTHAVTNPKYGFSLIAVVPVSK